VIDQAICGLGALGDAVVACRINTLEATLPTRQRLPHPRVAVMVFEGAGKGEAIAFFNSELVIIDKDFEHALYDHAAFLTIMGIGCVP